MDLVLTAEGALDEQTLMGKGVGELAQWCQRIQVPCLAFAGAVNDPTKAKGLFKETYAMSPDFVTEAEAMSQTSSVLQRLAEKAAPEWIAK
jgi:glycerate kinase